MILVYADRVAGFKNCCMRSGRYGKRAKEVAARTVLKQHKMKGHRKNQ